MDKEVFSTYLTDRYEDQVKWYDGKAMAYQAKYRRMQWPLIVFAALTPALVEVSLIGECSLLGHLAALSAVIVAILSSGLKVFKYQENWINYRTTCETLRKEKHFYNAGVGEYSGAKDREAVFVERVENLISRENTLWLSTQKAESKENENV